MALMLHALACLASPKFVDGAERNLYSSMAFLAETAREGACVPKNKTTGQVINTRPVVRKLKNVRPCYSGKTVNIGDDVPVRPFE